MRCTASSRDAFADQRIRRAGGAFVDPAGQLSASAYLLPGGASTYSRSVLGAIRTLEQQGLNCKLAKEEILANCAKNS